MRKLIIIRGVSGSGKTTLSKLLADAFTAQGFRAFTCEADNYFYDEDGNYNFIQSELSFAHEWCQDCAELYMEGGVEIVIVSNTFTQNWEMEPYIKLAEKFGYSVDSIVKENLHSGESVHQVPDKTLQRQRDRLKSSLRL